MGDTESSEGLKQEIAQMQALFDRIAAHVAFMLNSRATKHTPPQWKVDYIASQQIVEALFVELACAQKFIEGGMALSGLRRQERERLLAINLNEWIVEYNRYHARSMVGWVRGEDNKSVLSEMQSRWNRLQTTILEKD